MPSCDHKHVELAAIPKDYNAYISQLIGKIWQDKEAGILDDVLLNTYADKLFSAVAKGMGGEIPETEFNTDRFRLQTDLKRNVWQFSAAKTYTQLRDMSNVLYDAKGQIKPFNDFKRDAGLIAGQQLRWLRTEYDTAVAGSQMADKWQQIIAQRELFPLLEFDAIIDGHTSKICTSLNGVIRPVDDAFWKTYYPPNHFNCRSTVRQLKSGSITALDQIKYPTDVPQMFKVNLGEQNLIFPADHAYYTGMPKEVWEQARFTAPYELQFDILDISEKTSGLIRQHFLTDENGKDYQGIYKLALEQAAKGNLVDIMPILNPNQYREEQRLIIFKGAKARKSPDLRINGVYWEHEGVYTDTVRALKGAVESGAAQADHLFINISTRYSDAIMKSVSNLKFKDYPQLKTIVYIYKEESFIYERAKK